MSALMSFYKQIVFAQVQWLWLLVMLPLLLVWYFIQRNKLDTTFQSSNTEGAFANKKSLKNILLHLPFLFRCIALFCIIVALAKPQSTTKWSDTNVEGVDIVFAIDVSTSMLAQDFKPNRLEASKDVALDFIDIRPNDRFGLVIFGGEAFTQCPITTDHAILKNLFSEVKTGLLLDGTAIGMGLATAVNRLKESKAKSKIIILLTDGVNNQGAVSPETGAEIAKQYGIRVYTIGVGTTGKAYSPVAMNEATQELIYDYADVKIDETLLKQISKLTNAQYYRATNKTKLKEVYSAIDQLEKTRFEVSEYRKRKDEYFIFALIAFVCIALEFLINRIILNKFI